MKLDKKKLELARAKGCMTLKDLREKAKCSPNTIQKGLAVDIDPSVIGRIAEALGVDVIEIIQEPAESEG